MRPRTICCINLSLTFLYHFSDTHTHTQVHAHQQTPWIAAWQFAAAESRFTVTEEHTNPPEPSHTPAHQIPYKRNTLDSPKSHTHTYWPANPYDHYSLITQATGIMGKDGEITQQRQLSAHTFNNYIHSHQIYRWNYPFCQEKIFPDWVYALKQVGCEKRFILRSSESTLTRRVKDTVEEIAHFKRGKMYFYREERELVLVLFLSQSCRAITPIRLKETGLTAHTHTHTHTH